VALKTRLIVALIITAILGGPALFEAPWRFAGLLVFALNLPGVLLAIPHVPPEGYPGQSVVHASLLLVTQAVVWFTLLTVVTLFRTHATENGTPKA
jgi:hypothetical protein